MRYDPVKSETMTRADFCFDYHLPAVDSPKTTSLKLLIVATFGVGEVKAIC